MLGKGSGVGIHILDGDTGASARLAIPTKTTDAQRTEALGPALACLFIAHLFFENVDFFGDSKYVVGLLNREFLSVDYFLSSCIELVTDLLAKQKHFKATWIPRAQNTICDALARSAVHQGCVSVECSEQF